MHGPDGVDYPNKVKYLEVKKPERLVYVHGDEGEISYFHVTVTFEDKNDKTRLTMQMLFNAAKERNEVVEKFGAVEGLKQNMEKLDEYLRHI